MHNCMKVLLLQVRSPKWNTRGCIVSVSPRAQIHTDHFPMCRAWFCFPCGKAALQMGAKAYEKVKDSDATEVQISGTGLEGGSPWLHFWGSISCYIKVV